MRQVQRVPEKNKLFLSWQDFFNTTRPPRPVADNPCMIHFDFYLYIDGCQAVVSINYSLVTPVKRQAQSDGY